MLYCNLDSIPHAITGRTEYFTMLYYNLHVCITVAKENEVTAAQTTVKQAEMRFDFVF